MIVYAFMLAKETKEELIESMVFFEQFGHIRRYLKELGIAEKRAKSSRFGYQEQVEDSFRKSVGMGLGWKKVTCDGTLVGYWVDKTIRDSCIIHHSGDIEDLPLVLTVSDTISREEAFKGVFYLFPPTSEKIETKRFYKVNFTVNNNAVGSERCTCIVEAVNGKTAKRIVHDWLDSKLHGTTYACEADTNVEELSMENDILYCSPSKLLELSGIEACD